MEGFKMSPATQVHDGHRDEKSKESGRGSTSNKAESVAAHASHVDSSLDNDDEGEDSLQRANAEFFFGGGRHLLEKERRLGRLQLRSQQATLHNSLESMRLNDVERELQSLKATVLGLGDKPKVPNKIREKLPVHLHELRRSNIDEASLTHDIVSLPTTQQPSLEVLFNDKGSFSIHAPDMQHAKSNSEHEAAPHLATINQGVGADHPWKATPERLRIRSRQLLWHLETIGANSAFSLLRSSELKGLTVHSALVFLRPFKFFVESHAVIRKSLEDLEAIAKTASLDAESDQISQGPRHLRFEQPRFKIQDLLEDLRLLINFLDVDLKPTLELRRDIQKGTAVEIEYADLWHLFERGTYVVAEGNKDHAFMVVNVVGGRDPLVEKFPSNFVYEDERISTHTDEFIVECLSLGTNGESYVPKLDKFPIRKYHGSHPVSSLPIYPLHLSANPEELRSSFLSGGKRFFEITRKPFSHQTVRGKTLDEPSHQVDGQAIVDMTLAISAKPEWKPSETITASSLLRRDQRETYIAPWCRHAQSREGCCASDISFKDLEYESFKTESLMRNTGRLMGPVNGDYLENEHFMLMRPYVHSFVLRFRQWVTVRVKDLHPVEFENRLNDLVLPDSHKTTVRALVATHENLRTSHPSHSQPSISGALDLVKGKGSGLVILLHGPPGVGKTSTAECVADDTRRPLYPITCGDIGETAAEVESNLQRNFQLAHKWGCVLLLDEADIFLAKRTKHDLRHNAVTSVFLRSLEYYAGILFLTTNRVGTIDPAFKSRIQMSLFYPKLSLEVTLSLYGKFIKRARLEQERRQNHIFKIKDKEILKFAKRHFRELDKHGYDTWNGRQIRNAFQTAIALAEHESLNNAHDTSMSALGRSQFETVATGFKKFDDYINTTLGMKESVAAKRDLWRNDTYPGSERASSLHTPSVVTSLRTSGLHEHQSRRSRAAQSDCDEETQSDSDSDSDSDDDGLEGQTYTRQERNEPSRSSRVVISDTNVGNDDQLEENFRRFMALQKTRQRRP